MNENSHMILLSRPGNCKREYVQICAILLEAIVIVPDVRRFRDITLFETSLKGAIRAVIM